MEELLSELRKNNVLLRLEDGNLKVKMPKGVDAKALLMQIKAKKPELIEFIKEREGLNNTFVPVPEAEQRSYYPLSAAQNRMYFLYQFDKSSTAYNMPKALKLEGKADPQLIEKVFNELVQRHESLRTSFELVDDQVVQKVNGEVSFQLDYYETDQPDSILDGFIQPFDLSQAPLMRVGLIRINEAEHVLAVDMHHIISDGSSHALLIKEFMDIYHGKLLPKPRVYYKDYSVWQKSEERINKLSDQKKFWLHKLVEEVPVVDLPLDFSRPLIKSHGGNKLTFTLDQDRLTRLNQLGDQVGASLYMTVLSVFNVLLAKLSHQECITVGTPVAGRDHPDLESIIGMFVNTLTLRNYPKGELSFTQFLQSVREECLACFDNQAYQYEQLVDDLNIERATDRNPLFDIMFVFQNYDNEELSIPGLKLSTYPMEPVNAKFDIQLITVEQDGELHFTLEYATDLFQQATAERFIAYFRRIVDEVLQNPTVALRDINVLNAQEKHELLYTFNDTKADYPSDQTVISLFEVQAQAHGEAVALTMEEAQMSYAELLTDVNKVATYLQQQGVKPGDRVGVMYDRSFDMMIAIYGVMKAGAAYLPISPAYPQGRIDYILEDSAPSMVLAPAVYQDRVGTSVASAAVEEVRSATSESTFRDQSAPNGLAYVIYTSGSTGNPKGVMIKHESLVNRLHWMQSGYPLTTEDRLLQKTPTVFDVSLWELFWWAQQGASLCLLAVEGEKDPEQLCETIHRDQITTIHFVPSMLQAFLDHLEASDQVNKLSSLRQVFCSGEALGVNQVHRFKALLGDTNETRLINLYGPTEATVDVSYYNCELHEGDRNVPIGKPIDNIMLHVLDRYDQLQPIGVVGELCISGVGVGMGYLNNETLSQEKFVPNPHIPGARMYRTGDLARWLPDGNLEYLGRIDHQVKIRGYRIELGEIEHALQQHEFIREAVVITRDHEGAKQLVGYYVADQQEEISSLRSALAQRLPDYMIPTFFVHLDRLPLTSNGKLDRKSLPAPEVSQQESYQAPRTPEERLLCDVWSEVLGVGQIGIRDNFFAIGGDSIKSIQISSRVRKLGYSLTIQDLFTSQYIEELAPRMTQEVVAAEQGTVVGESALAPIQQWFFNRPSQTQHHFNLSVLLNFPAGLTAEETKDIFNRLVMHHDALRMVFPEVDGQVIQKNLGASDNLLLEELDLCQSTSPEADLLKSTEVLQASLDLTKGPLFKLGLYQMAEGSRLFVVVHHLLMDGVSWRILLEDIDHLYQQRQRMVPNLELPAKTEPYLNWSKHLATYQHNTAYERSGQYWKALASKTGDDLPRDFSTGTYTVAQEGRLSFHLDKQQTQSLLTEAHQSFGTQMNDLLLSALIHSLHRQFGLGQLRLDMEGHGREELGAGIDISRTIGWFTSIFPVHLTACKNDLALQIRSVKEALRGIPNKGFDYLLHQNETLATGPQSQLFFEYFGQFDQDVTRRAFTLASETVGANLAPGEIREYDWRVSSQVTGDELHVSVAYSKEQYKEETIAAFIEAYQVSLVEMIRFCVDQKNTVLSPSDVGYSTLTIQELDKLQQTYPLSDVYPLSPMQEGMLFHSLADTSSNQYFDQMTYHISGEMDIDRVESAMNLLMNRHEVLRTMFLPDRFERAVQLVLKDRKVDFAHYDVRSEVAAGDSEQVIERYKTLDKSRKFDLVRDTLMRLTVLRIAEEEYVFIWSHHHILMDGWCMGILINEYGYLYGQLVNGVDIELPPVRPYANYINWLEDRDGSQSQAYWTHYLAGYENQAGFPKKEGALPNGLNYELQKSSLTLDEANTSQLKALCAQNGVTPNTIIQAVWGILLGRYNNTADVVFGAVVSGRPGEIIGVEDMVGLFINTIPVRIKVDTADTIGTLLKRLQQEALATEAHHYSPLYDVQQWSELGRDLLDHILVFENYPVADEIQGSALDSTNTTIKKVNIFEQDNYDLSLEIQVGTDIRFHLSYNALVYEERQIVKLLEAYEHVLQQLVASPNMKLADISILRESDRKIQLQDFNDSFCAYPENETFPGLFTEAAGRFPERIAVSDATEELTYKELNGLANRIAGFLQAQGLKAGQIIPLVLPRATPLIACMLGVQKAGYVFVAIDVEHPLSRITGIIEDCQAQLVIGDPNFSQALEASGQQVPYHVEVIHDNQSAKSLFAAYPSDNIHTSLTPDDITYMIYTSGSTGKPKGVLLHQQGMVNHFRGLIDLMEIDERDCLAQTAECSFDIFVVQALLCLMVGGRTEVVSKEVMLDANRFSSLIDQKGITIVELVPTVLKFLLDDRGFDVKGDQLRWLISCGERLTRNLSESWYARFPDTRVVNAYGPAEASDDVTSYVVPRYSNVAENYHVPIGKPLANVKMYILDSQLRLCPIGVKGEICISGIAVGKGYWRNETQTRKKFVANPYISEVGEDQPVIYRTGDTGYWQEDGNMVFLGRMDNMVKVRGARIELGEVESVVLKVDSIEQVVVIVKEAQLCCYYVTSTRMEVLDLREQLKEMLPDFMMPTFLVHLEDMPLTGNGKIDRRALPDPDLTSGGQYVAPVGEMEIRMTGIWSEILEINAQGISATKSFFELGGHSLNAVKLIFRVEKEFGVKIPLSFLFQQPTVRDLCNTISVAKIKSDAPKSARKVVI